MTSTPSQRVLCDKCLGITLQDLKSSHGYVHCQTLRQLVSSAETCKLCAVILDVCQQFCERHGTRVTPHTLDVGPVRLLAISHEEASSKAGERHYSPVLGRKLASDVVVFAGEPLDDSLDIDPTRSVLLEMYASEGSSAAHAGVDTSLKDIEGDAAQHLNFVRLRSWLRECKTQHKSCSLENITKLTGSFSAPRRLIDLGLLDNLSSNTLAAPKIVSTNGRREEYVALSYCWGLESYLRTLTDNIRQMEISIPVDQLPKTIKDAFVIAGKLGVRYVWVDALCIIQDDPADWEAEAKRMGAIYASAFFTVAATSASQADQGFLNVREPKRAAVPFRSGPDQQSSGELYFRQPSDFLSDYHTYILEGPLRKRAWVLQEALLSRRTVHFTDKQIYMECRCSMFAEDGNVGDAYDRSFKAHSFLDGLTMIANTRGLETYAKIFFDIWQEIIQRYTTLSITRSSDRLPALSGLASLVERNIDCQYLYGIWSFNIAYGLLWHPGKPPMVPAEEWRAPSWSWAAWDGSIFFESYFSQEASRIQLLEMTETNNIRGGLRVRGRILSCNVSLDLRPEPKPCRSDRKLGYTPSTSAEYAFAADEATLRAYNVKADYEPFDDGDETARIPISRLRISEGRLMSAQSPAERNICRFDGWRGVGTDFHFLVLACDDSMKFHHCQGLILERLNSEIETYKRVGAGWSTDQVWHTCSESIITLV